MFYADSFGGYLTRLDRSTGQTRFVSVWPEYPVGPAPRDLKERFQWTLDGIEDASGAGRRAGSVR